MASAALSSASAMASAMDTYFSQKLPKGKSSGLPSDTETVSGYHIHLLRLGSFIKWPHWAKAMPTRLARAGFYYLGSEDEVECFSCKGRIKGWREGDRPMTRHQSLNSNCEFIRHAESVDIPLPGRTADIMDTDEAPTRHASLPLPLTTPPIPDAAPPQRRIHSMPIVNEDTEIVTIRPEYRREQARLDTFMDWPTTAFVGPQELAQAGFVYLGSGDRVQCAFCKGVLRNWAPGDRAFHEHSKHFPMCPFVKNPQRCNQPPEEPRVQRPRTIKRQDSSTNPDLRQLHELGIETDLPKNHRMAILETRLETFKGAWPTGKTQKPKDLAESGFYHIGQGDSVKCFWCDGGLRNWEAGDDPWIEHARWFSKCGHLKRTKGEDFIKAVKDNRASPPPPSRLDPREITARMDTPVVKTVLDLGFEQDFVKDVIHYRLATSGDDFASSADLIETILNYQESPPFDFPMPLPDKIPQASGGSGSGSPSTGKKNKKNKKKKSSSASSSLGSASSTSEPKGETTTGRNSPMETGEISSASGEEGAIKTTECKICMNAQVSVVFLPCRHLVSCSKCAPALKECPLCRGSIKGTIDIFMS